MKHSRNYYVMLMACAAILWSTGGLLVKMVDWHPMAIVSVRGMFSCALTAAYLVYDKKKSGRKGPLVKLSPAVLMGGTFSSLLSICYVNANKLTTAANAIVLQFTSPLWLILFTILILRKRIRKEELITVLAVFAGMVLFFIDGLETGNMLGNLIATFSGVSLAGMVLVMKNNPEDNPTEMLLVGNIILVLSGIGFITKEPLTLQGFLIIAALGIFQFGLPFILYSRAIPHLSSVDAVLIPILEPILNPLWVFLFQGETIGQTALFGALIVMTSVVIHNIAESKRPIRA